jgi:hypothetical protein
MSPQEVQSNAAPVSGDIQRRETFDELDHQARVLLRVYLSKKRAFHRSFADGQEAAIREAHDDLQSFLRACLGYFGGMEPTVALLHVYAGHDQRLADLVRLMQEDLLETYREGLLLSATLPPTEKPIAAHAQSAPTAAGSTGADPPLDPVAEKAPVTGKPGNAFSQVDLALLLDPTSYFQDRPPPVLARTEETEEAMLAKLQRLCQWLKTAIDQGSAWAKVHEAVRDFQHDFPLFNDDRLSPNDGSKSTDSNWFYRATDHSWWVRVILKRKPHHGTSYRIISFPAVTSDSSA